MKRHRRGHALRRRYGHAGKTFGRVPVGALFQLKDDPDSAMLQKVGKSAFVVVGSKMRHAISPNYPIKRGRQS